MATSNLFWSASAASSSAPPDLIPDDPNRLLPDSDPTKTSTQPTKPKSGAAGRGKKRIQRGPGVAQLERLRIQERVPRLSTIDEARDIQTLHPFQNQLPPIYGTPVKRFASASGIWMESPPPSAGFCYLPLDRRRIAMAGSKYQKELPSNQSVLCISQHCKLCALHRKEFNAGEYLPIDLNNAPPVNQERSVVGYPQGVKGGYPVAKMEVTEYDFFPHKTTSEAAGGDSEFVDGDHLVGEGSAHFLDLSLGL